MAIAYRRSVSAAFFGAWRSCIISEITAEAIALYPHNPRQQKLHQGFFLFFHFFQLTLMKGDKVVEIFKISANFLLFIANY